MAQTFVVLTAGIDLSVGMIFVLTNCLASWLVVGTPLETALGVVGVLLAGLACGALNGADRHLRPPAADRRHHRHRRGLSSASRCCCGPFPGGVVNEDLADALTGKLFGVMPASLVALLAVVLVVWVPFRRSVLGRAAYAVGSSEVAAYMSGVPIRRGQVPRLRAGRPARRDRRAVPHLLHLFGRGRLRQRQHLHAVLDRRGGARRRVAVRRPGSAIGAIFGALRLPHHRRSAVRLRPRPALAAAVPGRRAAGRGQPRRVRGCSGSATGWSCSDER